jgi:hypothetical protein
VIETFQQLRLLYQGRTCPDCPIPHGPAAANLVTPLFQELPGVTILRDTRERAQAT